jgi:hypothetical protein
MGDTHSLDVGIQCLKETTSTIRPAPSKDPITHPCCRANLQQKKLWNVLGKLKTDTPRAVSFFMSFVIQLLVRFWTSNLHVMGWKAEPWKVKAALIRMTQRQWSDIVIAPHPWHHHNSTWWAPGKAQQHAAFLMTPTIPPASVVHTHSTFTYNEDIRLLPDLSPISCQQIQIAIKFWPVPRRKAKK